MNMNMNFRIIFLKKSIMNQLQKKSYGSKVSSEVSAIICVRLFIRIGKIKMLAES